MKSQRDTSLRIRLAGMAILGLFIALAATAYFSGQEVKRASELISTDAVPGTIKVHGMRMAMDRSIGFLMVAASAQTTQSRDKYLKMAHDGDMAFPVYVKEYEATMIINPAKDRGLLTRVTSQFAEYDRQRMAYEALILTGDRNGSAVFLESKLMPVYFSAILSAEELLKYNHANSITYAIYIHNSVHRLYWTAAIVMVLALACAGVLVVNFAIRRKEIMRLRESEELFRTSFESSTAGVCLVATDGRFLNVNRTLCEMLGYSKDELLQLTFNDVTYEEDKEIGLTLLVKAQSGGSKIMRTEKRYLHKNGSVVWAYLSTALIEKSRDIDSYMISYIQDITERKRAEDKLRASSGQLRALTGRLESLREEERTRISREVHDDLGQRLTGLKMDLDWLENQLVNISDEQVRTAFEEKIIAIGEIADETMVAVQRIAAELRPAMLDNLGLVSALRHEASQFEERAKIQVNLNLPNDLLGVDGAVTTTVFRIFQEILTNVARHAEATTVEVDLMIRDARLILSVRDNGKGMPTEHLTNPRSLGLLGMTERAAMVNGRVSFEVLPGLGTSVELQIPIGVPTDLTPLNGQKWRASRS